MHVIFLRGSVPPAHEHPEKLVYDTIDNCEDMWTQLFYYYLKESGNTGELIYEGSSRGLRVDNRFTELWVPSIKHYKPHKKPGMIICRGGFRYYEPFLRRYPKVKKVYYGAGKRFYPQGYDEYDLILTDSPRQLEVIQKKKKPAALFIKPAATLFKPVSTEKTYDICFMANATQSRIKRHELLLNAFAGSEFRILNLGNYDKRLRQLAKRLNVIIKWGGWHRRKQLPRLISSCRVGICCSTNYDSCPRVIPEYLACNLPVVVTSNINFWDEQYINKDTGILATEDELIDAVKALLKLRPKPRRYYESNLSMECAARYLDGLIRSYVLK